MSVQGSKQIVTGGLVLDVDASNPKSYLTGSQVISTLIGGSTYSASLNGGFSGSGNGFLYFDGTSNVITTNLLVPSPTTAATTYDLWFQNYSTASYKGLIGSSNYGVSGFSIGLMGQTSMHHTYNSASAYGEIDFTYNTSTISHGVFIFSARTVMVYRNGVLVYSNGFSFDSVASPNPITIGSCQQGGWTLANVGLYSARVYTRALSSDEVLQNYNAIKSRFGLT